MHDGKKEMPEMWRVVLALLVFGDVPPLPLTGFIAETTDTHEKYFHAFNTIGYSTDLIAKWDYLDEIAPEYCMKQKGGNHENSKK